MAISFEDAVAPLFRSGDVQCMGTRGVDLADYGYMADAAGDGVFADHANARHVMARLTGTEAPRMPQGGPFWSAAQLVILQRWFDDGFAP